MLRFAVGKVTLINGRQTENQTKTLKNCKNVQNQIAGSDESEDREV